MKLFSLLLLTSLLVTSCGPSRKTPAEPGYLDNAPARFPLVAGVASPDDVSKFLGGRPVGQGAFLSRLQQTSEYQVHQVEVGQVWSQRIRPRVHVMERWAASEITPVAGSGVVNYPFGGPDLLHVSALFPEARAYVLMGLEPVGEVPALEALPPGDVLSALATYREATKTAFLTGYFITKDMRSDLDRSALRGVTPILLGTVAMMGGSVESVNAISAGGNPGVQLQFRDVGGTRHTVYYVSGDLSNGGFKDGYRKWLSGLGGRVTYFKAASYLMHDSGFSRAREFFLNQSQVVLQDDSGIPFRYFASDSAWTTRLYGHYERPIPLFAKHQQEDLRQAYSAGPVHAVTFPSGYQYDYRKANLVLATKR